MGPNITPWYHSPSNPQKMEPPFPLVSLPIYKQCTPDHLSRPGAEVVPYRLGRGHWLALVWGKRCGEPEDRLTVASSWAQNERQNLPIKCSPRSDTMSWGNLWILKTWSITSWAVSCADGNFAKAIKWAALENLSTITKMTALPWETRWYNPVRCGSRVLWEWVGGVTIPREGDATTCSGRRRNYLVRWVPGWAVRQDEWPHCSTRGLKNAGNKNVRSFTCHFAR